MKTYKDISRIVASGVLAGFLGGAVGNALAQDVYLVAKAGNITMPDGRVVPVWGFALDADGDLSTVGSEVPSVPGPRISVPDSDPVLNIHLRNDLAVPVSLVIPGQSTAMHPVFFNDANGKPRVRSFTDETAPGGTFTYSWSNLRPGSFIYESGTHPAVQVQMGLYGAVTRDSAPGVAYPGAAYSNEALLFYSELDPDLHDAVAGGNYGPGQAVTSTIGYQPRYFLINGQPYPAAAPVQATPIVANQPLLLRLFNAGLQTHVPVLNGAHISVVAEDGNAYPYERRQYAVMLAAGQTKDAVFVPAAQGRYPVFDGRRDLSNATQPDGGMLAYLEVGAAASGAPVGLADAYSVAEDSGPLSVPAPGVLSNDTGSGPLTASLVEGPAVGTLNLGSDGAFSYTPPLNFNGSVGFTYRASDGTLSSGPTAVAITVTPTNDPPTAVADAYSVNAGATLTIAAPGVLGNDSDIDGDALTAALDTGPANGSASVNADGSFTYTPNAGFSGGDSFTYSASDGSLSATATVTVTVNAPVNTAPVANDDFATTTRNTSVVINLIANDSDADGSIDPASIVITAGPQRKGSTVTVNPDGTVTYAPRPKWRGTDQFRYTVRDNLGALSNEATVTVNVQR